jgi:phosphonate transport system ATP-binding protein
VTTLADAALLEFDKVEVRYGDITVLGPLDLRVGVGERVAIIGPSGAGKSTLLGLCNGTVRATAGVVCFRNEPVADTDAWRRHQGRLIGTVHQQLNLVGPLRVIHNVNAGRLGDWSTAKSLLSLIRPSERASSRELLASVGLIDKIDARTDELSGGEQQRVAIARVLAQSPSLILADEPVSSLDPARAADIVNLLIEHATTQRTLVASLHTFDLARRHFDRIVALRAGHIVFDCAASDVSDHDASLLYRLESPAQ